MRRFDRITDVLIEDPKLKVVTLADLADLGSPISLAGDERLFAAYNMYDIAETMVRALQALGKRFPDSYVSVHGFPKDLRALTGEKLGVRVIAQTTICPPEITAAQSELWQATYAVAALESGCDGVIVHQGWRQLARQYPEAEIFTAS